jgi:hypothetical protein
MDEIHSDEPEGAPARAPNAGAGAPSGGAGPERRLLSNDIRNPATGDTENPATPVMLMPRPEPVRHWI